MSSDFKKPQRPVREELLAAGLPEEAVQFFTTGWDSIDRVMREAEEHAQKTKGAIQEALLADEMPERDRVYRMLEGAANFAHVQEFESLVDRFLKQIDPNQPLDYFKRTPFQLAAGLGSVHAMTQLLGGGAVVDSIALRKALYWPECVVWLLDRGADSEGVDDWGVTCLMQSCLRGLTGTVEILLKHRARVDTQEVDGRTALWFSSRSRRQRCVELLLAAGAEPNLPDHYGRTPLMRAKNLAIAKLLLEAGADPTVRDSDGQSAYDLAGGRWEFRQILAAAEDTRLQGAQ